MKFAMVIAVVALLGLLAIVLPKQQGTDQSEECARALAAVAKSMPGHPSVSNSGAQVSVSGRQVSLRARIENRKRAQNKFAVGLAVDLYVDGVFQPLTAGSVGVGVTEAEAMETAVQEWALLVGEALVPALVSNRNAGLKLDGFIAYPGLTAIRGSEIALPEKIGRDLLGHVKTLVPKLRSSGGELHSILIMVEVKDGVVAGGECRVDGDISPEALTAIRAFPWPQKNAQYLFKQFYVLRQQ